MSEEDTGQPDAEPAEQGEPDRASEARRGPMPLKAKLLFGVLLLNLGLLALMGILLWLLRP